MIVTCVYCVCPFCDGNVKIEMSKMEVEHDDFGVLLSFECPECGEYVEKEKLEY